MIIVPSKKLICRGARKRHLKTAAMNLLADHGVDQIGHRGHGGIMVSHQITQPLQAAFGTQLDRVPGNLQILNCRPHIVRFVITGIFVQNGESGGPAVEFLNSDGNQSR